MIHTNDRRTYWFLGLRKEISEHGTYFFPTITSEEMSDIRLSFFMCPYDTNFKSLIYGYKYRVERFGVYTKFREVLRGKNMDILDLMTSKNGFSENGTFCVEFRMRIEGYTNHHNVWNFNFSAGIFGAKNTIVLKNGSWNYHGCKQLLLFHSPEILSLAQEEEFEEREQTWNICLQIAHGVQTTCGRRFDVVEIAQRLELFNVVLRVDRQLRLYDTDSTINDTIQAAADLNLRHFLAKLLKIDVKSNREFIKIIKTLDLEDMSGEAMKMIVAKALYGKF
ncbi:unnamed protein product [Caenorhabditis nigoni]